MTAPAALILGGTRGLGRAVGRALAARGLEVWLTHRWNSTDPAALQDEWAALGAPPPVIVEADAGHAPDGIRLAARLAEAHPEGLAALIFSVSVVQRGAPLAALRPRTLRHALRASAWALPAQLQALQASGCSPRTVLVLSSDGVDHVYPGYAQVAAAKSAQEAMVRALAAQGMVACAIRARQVHTTGFGEVFGPEVAPLLAPFARYAVAPEEVGEVAALLCTGALPGVSGQILTLDRGAARVDNLLSLAQARHTPPTSAETAGQVRVLGPAGWLTEAAAALEGALRGETWLVPVEPPAPEASVEALDAWVAEALAVVDGLATARRPRRVVWVLSCAARPPGAAGIGEALLRTAVAYLNAELDSHGSVALLVVAGPAARAVPQGWLSAVVQGTLDSAAGGVVPLGGAA